MSVHYKGTFAFNFTRLLSPNAKAQCSWLVKDPANDTIGVLDEIEGGYLFHHHRKADQFTSLEALFKHIAACAG